MQILGTLILGIIILLIHAGRLVRYSMKLLYRFFKGLFHFLTDYFSGMQAEIVSFVRIVTRLRKYLEKIWRQRAGRQRKLKGTVVFSVPVRTKVKYFVLGGIFSALFIVLPVLFFLTLENLPSPNDLSLEQLPQTTKIYDRNHILLYEIYATQNRTYASLSQIPANLRKATIAIEDKNFYKNPGVDVAAIIRAALADVQGKELQGGSTITQQLVKVALLSPKVSVVRKAEEIILAVWTEKRYTKNQILEMYFNRVPYGGTAWGAEAAAEVYFGEKVKDLDLAQCAFLAGIPQAPSIYSPYGSTPSLWKNRQKEVLHKMQYFGYITASQEKQAEEEQLTFQSPQTPIHAPHFVMFVKDWLVQKYGLNEVEKGGLEVTTSLDLKLQDITQNIVTNQVNQNAYLNLSNGAAVITNPKNGDILAMVGSKDYNDPNSGTVNLATSLRQPGSSIKVVTYAAALSRGMTAATRIDDVPTTFTSQGSPPYTPVNYDGKWHGSITMRTALANSLNIPAVKTLNTIGVPTFISLAKQMGINSLGEPSQYGLSITLGGAEVTMLDMATAYTTLANEGEHITLNPILHITTNKGTVLEEKQEITKTQVIDPGVAYILANILSDNDARSMEFGNDSPLRIPNHTVAVKTGTSDNKKDNWTIGYTKDYVVTTWVGNNNGDPMNPSLASGITGAAPIWHDIMTNLLKDIKDEPFIEPANIIEKNCNGKKEYFIRGTENSANCNGPFPSISPTQQADSNNQIIQHIILPFGVTIPKQKTCRYKSGSSTLICP